MAEQKTADDHYHLERYRDYLKEQTDSMLRDNKDLIEQFKEHASSKGVPLSDSDFDYVQSIGIVASKPSLLLSLSSKIQPDKEGLIKFSTLASQFEVKKFISGYFYDTNFMIMPHHFFRRGFAKRNNFAPLLVDRLWSLSDPNIETSIAVDLDRVRINVDETVYMEMDTWYGAPFSKDIGTISDGLVKLHPPLDLESSHISFLFNDAHSLNAVWNTKEGVKSFQAEEFKSEDVKIQIDGQYFYPARYIHAEYVLDKKQFRHFDGAVHLYTEDEYYRRRDYDFNYNSKGNGHIKAKSVKIFKMNGTINVDTWVDDCCHFCSGNPLILEYFDGKYPDNISDMVNKLRKNKPT